MRIWNGIIVSRLGNLIGFDLRGDFYRQVLRLDMANFNESGRGDLMNRCTSDLNSLSQGVQRLFGQALMEPLKMLVCVVIAAWISWRLLLLTDHYRAGGGLLDSLAGQGAEAHAQQGDAGAVEHLRNTLGNAWRHQADQSIYDGDRGAE